MSLMGKMRRLILDDNRRALQRTLQELDRKKESILSEYPGLFSDSDTEGGCDVYNDLAQQEVGPLLVEALAFDSTGGYEPLGAVLFSV